MVYDSGMESNKTVKEIEIVNMTIIRPLRFAALNMKLMLARTLAVASLMMWNWGYTPVGHDELRLTQLLRRRIEEINPVLALLSKDDITLQFTLRIHKIPMVKKQRPSKNICCRKTTGLKGQAQDIWSESNRLGLPSACR